MNNTVAAAPASEQKIQLRGSPLKKEMPQYANNGGPVTPVHSIGEFLDLVENTRENELVIVKVHAKWCRVCARAILKYKKMAQKYSSTATNTVPIKFISVEASSNKKIIEELGIRKFPYIQIYRNRECVASFGTGPVHNFERMTGSTIEQKLNTTEEQWDAFRSEFKDQIASNLQNLDALRLDAEIEEECVLNEESLQSELCLQP